MKKIGLFYCVNTESTANVAKLIYKAIGEDSVEVVSVEDAWIDDFARYDTLILGTSTWFDGELPTYWDELIPLIESLDLKNKEVAIFGLGDQKNYPETFVDGVGILANSIEKTGAKLIGCTSVEGYEYEKSCAVKNGKFLGLVIDERNQQNKTAGRINEWAKLF
jgi:flavodoxin, long chain